MLSSILGRLQRTCSIPSCYHVLSFEICTHTFVSGCFFLFYFFIIILLGIKLDLTLILYRFFRFASLTNTQNLCIVGFELFLPKNQIITCPVPFWCGVDKFHVIRECSRTPDDHLDSKIFLQINKNIFSVPKSINSIFFYIFSLYFYVKKYFFVPKNRKSSINPTKKYIF